MHVINIILYCIYFLVAGIIAVYLLIPGFFLLVYLLRKLFRAKGYGEKKPLLTDREFEFGLIITAHEETEFITPLVDSILKQTYGRFAIYVVADKCDISGLKFTDPRVNVLRPEDPLNSKIRSINYGISHFRPGIDAMIILDADNLLHPLFLATMNTYFRKGYRAVQADFKPKNTDSHFARMDAIGDVFNFFVEREMRMELGLSAAIWGSGIAVDLELYREVEYSSHLGGFDKKLQAHLLQRVPQIGFAREAVLYDEKIDSGASLETQRTRWINAQFKYMKIGFRLMLEGIRKGSFNIAYVAFVTIRPPLFLLLLIAFFITGLSFLIDLRLGFVWVGLLLLFGLSFAGIVFVKGRKLAGTLFMIPVFMMRQVFAFAKIGRANKSFMKTTHTKVMYIEEVLQQQRS
ncbi:MAG: glycosyltransferase [Chitinophagaceae bacterium]|nr:MAG: glycosyltransferase [Chitinophagaceae bacterium]